MPVDMNETGRHHRRTGAPPQIAATQPQTLGASVEHVTGLVEEPEIFEWECPACSRKQISRPADGCGNPDCSSRLAAPATGGSTSTDPLQGPGRPDVLEDVLNKARAMQGVDPTTGAPYPSVEYRLIEIRSRVGADTLLPFGPGEHQVDAETRMVVMPVEGHEGFEAGITPYNLITDYREKLTEEASAMSAETLPKDERAVVDFAVAALAEQLKTLKVTSYGGEVITPETLDRLRKRLLQKESDLR